MFFHLTIPTEWTSLMNPHTAVSHSQVCVYTWASQNTLYIWVNKMDLDVNNCHVITPVTAALRLYACTYMCPVMLRSVMRRNDVQYKVYSSALVLCDPSDGAVRCCGASSSSPQSIITHKHTHHLHHPHHQERICRQMQKRSAS